MTAAAPPRLVAADGRPLRVAVFGSGDDECPLRPQAYALGAALQRAGAEVWTGGRAAGVMEWVSEGAAHRALDCAERCGQEVGPLEQQALCEKARSLGARVVAYVPGTALERATRWSTETAPSGQSGLARSVVMVDCVDAAVALGGDTDGTVAELAAARKARRPVVLVWADEQSRDFWGSVHERGGAKARYAGVPIHVSGDDVVACLTELLARQ